MEIVQEINIIEPADASHDVAAMYAQYLRANYLHTKGRASEALKSYQQVFAHTKSPYVYDGFFRLLFDAGQFQTIISLYKKKAKILKKTFENNLEFQLLVAQSYLSIGKESIAEKLFSAMAATYPDNEQVAYYTALSFIQNNQLKKAHSFIDVCLKRPVLHQKYFLFYFLKSKIYLQEQNAPQALAMIEKSIALFPKFDRGWLFKAILLEQQGKINDAIAGYKKFLAIVGSEEQIEKQLIQLLFSQKRYGEAAHYLKKMRSHRPEYFFDLAIIEFKAGNYGSALEHIDACLAKSATFAQAQLLKVEILLAQKKPITALSFLKDLLKQNPQDNLIIHAILLLHNAGISRSKLIATIEDINRITTPSLGILSALADLCVENGNYRQGVTYYHSIFNLIQDEKLKADILYHMAYVFYTAKSYKSFENFISKALKFKVVSPNLCNLIAFYYVQENKNFDQALTLIENALATNPNSPYYLDTKGLILTKMGNRDQAVVIFKKALLFSPNDKIILEHLALAEKKDIDKD